MPKIERRRATATLTHGNYAAELADLADRALAALRAEQSGATPKRAGTKSEANRLAREYDAKLAEAESTATDVTVWAISYLDWDPLADEHPPREGDSEDELRGVNMKTFPLALLKVSLVTPGEANDFDDLKAKGEAALVALGDLSRVQFKKLEMAAWNVNVGDDALPKESLVSTLKLLRDPDSSQPRDSE